MATPKVIFCNPKASPEAIQAAHRLAHRYITITVDELINTNPISPIIPLPQSYLHALTGFGDIMLCTLCKASNLNCMECIYSIDKDRLNNCMRNFHEESYKNISEAVTPKQLIEAIRNRSAHIKEVLRQIEFIQSQKKI